MMSVTDLDRAVLLWINGFAHHYRLFDQAVVTMTNEAFLKGGLFFIFLWWMWFRNPRGSEEDRIDVIRIVVALCLAVVVARVLQSLLPARARPLNTPDLAFVPPYTQPTGYLTRWSSFPSDHAVVFFALATAIWARYRIAGAVAFLWVIVFGMLPRLYAGLHYPSDIIAGALIGILTMRVVEALPVPRIARPLIERVFVWERRAPALFYCVAVAVTFELMSMFDDFRIIGRLMERVL